MPYYVHLRQFEGPLDLLLHLIEQAQVDIKDIFVSEITAEYMAYMGQIQQLDLDTASEFLSMAATLLYIKSRQLLPRPPKEQPEEEEDPEILLIRQLREYKAFKRASQELEALFQNAQGTFTRLPEEFVLPPQEISLKGASLEDLYASFFTLLHARDSTQEPLENPLHQVQQDVFTVRRQLIHIRQLLQERQQVSFEELFAPMAPKMELIVTFMALLEMLARGEIHLKQSAPFAPIRLQAKALLEDDSDTDYMDEYTD